MLRWTRVRTSEKTNFRGCFLQRNKEVRAQKNDCDKKDLPDLHCPLRSLLLLPVVICGFFWGFIHLTGLGKMEHTQLFNRCTRKLLRHVCQWVPWSKPSRIMAAGCTTEHVHPMRMHTGWGGGNVQQKNIKEGVPGTVLYISVLHKHSHICFAFGRGCVQCVHARDAFLVIHFWPCCWGTGACWGPWEERSQDTNCLRDSSRVQLPPCGKMGEQDTRKRLQVWINVFLDWILPAAHMLSFT